MPEIMLNETEESHCAAKPYVLHNLNKHRHRTMDMNYQELFTFKTNSAKTVQICTHPEMSAQGKHQNEMNLEEIQVTDSCCRKVWHKIKLHITKKCYKVHREAFFNMEPTIILSKRIQLSLPRHSSKAPIDTLMVERGWCPFTDTPWTYRGEGNANLVISLPKEKIIFRFHKLEYEIEVDGNIIVQEGNKVKRDVQFGNAIMAKFIGIAYVQPPHLAKFSDNDAVKLDSQILKMRPIHRRHKGVRCGWVTVSPDYAFLPPLLNYSSDLQSSFRRIDKPTFCLELKPKQGWINPEDRHHPKCIFCLNQYLKVEKKCVSRISKYCPLDLFSGNKERMVMALRNLLETPQNNLKIFQDGLLVYSDEYGNYIDVLRKWLEQYTSSENNDNEWLMKKWCSLIQRALIREMTDVPLLELPHLRLAEEISYNSCTASKSLEKSPLFQLLLPCDWSADNLPSNCILNRILQMQKLQTTGFKSIYREFKKLKDEESDYCYVRRISENTNLSAIERYLLATTAKDCSIMIAFQRADEDHVDKDTAHYIEDCDGTGYIINIGVSDLDPKPLSCVNKHYKRDKDVFNACLHAYRCDEWMDHL